MSEDTGGKYYYVVDPSDLESAFRHVSDDLRTQYLLGYYSQDKSDDKSFRRIRVKLTDGAGRDALSLRYRTGYFPDARSARRAVLDASHPYPLPPVFCGE